MHDYLLSTEMVRFAFIFGVAVSMLLYEKRHLTTGSIVVPGYIATFFIYPFIIVATFANALMTYWLVNRLLRRWFLLYGRTKITVLAMISIGIQTAMLKLTPSGPWLWESDFKLIVGVGYVVPALIAHDMGRQGIAKTTKSVLLASSIVGVPIVLALAFNVPGVNDLAPLTGFGDMALDAAWLPVAVLLSASAAWGVANNYGLRSGGFVGAAFVGMLLGDPWQLVIAVTIAAITYVLVTRVFMKNMILFGRRKFSAMLLTASSISWALMWTGAEFFGPGVQEHLDIGSLALTPLFIPGLLANDAQRTSPTRVLIGVSLAASFVLATTWWVQSMFEEVSLHVGWKIVSVLTFTAIFGRQLVPANIMATADTTVADEHEYQLAPVPASTGAAILDFPRSAVSYAATGYEWWAVGHPEAAASAKRWLSAMATDTFTPAVVSFRVSEPSDDRPNSKKQFQHHQIGSDDMSQHDSHGPSRRRGVPVDQLRRAALNASRRRRDTPQTEAPPTSERDLEPAAIVAPLPTRTVIDVPSVETPDTVAPNETIERLEPLPVTSLQLVEVPPHAESGAEPVEEWNEPADLADAEPPDLPLRQHRTSPPVLRVVPDHPEESASPLPRRDVLAAAAVDPPVDSAATASQGTPMSNTEPGRLPRRVTLEERQEAKIAATRAALPRSELDGLAEDVSANLGRGSSSLRWRTNTSKSPTARRSAIPPKRSSPMSPEHPEAKPKGTSSPAASERSSVTRFGRPAS